ncbi:allantoinase-like [Homarus americanus]|uniref:allantoinase-like n=1 Tax=Homarus americanus TaxID=6706 RepID=UPI001C456783|nr:allantoinase-like [Homarus americanus]
MMADIQAFVSNAVVFPDETCPAVIQVKDGKIYHISRHSTNVSAFSKDQVVDCEALTLMPGIVDSHVHVNEPGRTAWEGYNSATQAAAAGGITTIVDMPLNSIPPTTTLQAWETKMRAAKGHCWVDVGFWGGVVPGNSSELRNMVKRGICGFKCFLIHSGVDEFPSVNSAQVEEALLELSGTQSVLLFHAECDIGDTITDADPSEKYCTFLKSRPQKMEELAIEKVISLCEKTKVRCHIVHLSASKALPMIRAAQARGVPLSVETCHHYLSLTAEEIPDNATQFKCCPPIREACNQNQLWEAVRDGTIQQVVSDHSPCTPDLKQPGEMHFMEAWGGIASVQFGLSLFWTEASARGFTLQDVVKNLCVGPASQASLHHCKAALKVGHDADFVIWNPTESFTVDTSMIYHKNKITPYVGKTLKGKVYKTVLHGKVIFEDGMFCKCEPQGTFVFPSVELMSNSKQE